MELSGESIDEVAPRSQIAPARCSDRVARRADAIRIGRSEFTESSLTQGASRLSGVPAMRCVCPDRWATRGSLCCAALPSAIGATSIPSLRRGRTLRRSGEPIRLVTAEPRPRYDRARVSRSPPPSWSPLAVDAAIPPARIDAAVFASRSRAELVVPRAAERSLLRTRITRVDLDVAGVS